LRIDSRFGAGDPGRLRVYAAELVSIPADVIVTGTGPAVSAIQEQTQTIPVIFTGVGDPIVNGLVKSLAHPEGNITGVTNLFSSIGGKWLELLKQAAPKIEKVGVIYNAQFPTSGSSFFASIEEAARALDVQVIRIGYRDAVDLVHAIDAFGTYPNRGLIVLPAVPTPARREAIFRLTTEYRLPAIYPGRQYAIEGGLMGYGSNQADQFRRAASFVDRIFHGTTVSELPVEYPVRFDLAINLTTAKALGLEIPPTLRALATEVIE
jgi:putative ABC transport system substrate-binding protein